MVAVANCLQPSTRRGNEPGLRFGFPEQYDAALEVVLIAQHLHRRPVICCPNRLGGTKLPEIRALDLVEVDGRAVGARLRHDALERAVDERSICDHEADT